MTGLVLAAHGSVDPRSAANTRAIARQLRRLAPQVDVRVAFCDHNAPMLPDLLRTVEAGAVVVPFLLASAYHARVDIPAMIAATGAPVRLAAALGEDDRLVRVLAHRLAPLAGSRFDPALGVLVVAVGSSDPAANARTAGVAARLAHGTRWAGVEVAFATGPAPTLPEAAARLRERGAARLVIAPWFLAPGRITDRVAGYARREAIAMAEPLGAHRLVAETVLDRFAAATARGAAA